MLTLAAGLAWLISRPTAVLPPRDAAGGEVLRVGVANLWFGNPQGARVARTLVALDLDLLVLLEWTGGNLDLAPLEAAGYRVVTRFDHDSGAGIGVLARDGIAAVGRVRHGPLHGPCNLPVARLRLPFGSGHLALIGVHAPPPVDTCGDTTDAWIAAVASDVTGGSLAGDVPPGRAGDPVVVLGDLNALPWWDGPRALQDAGLVDAWDAVQHLPGPTWGPLPTTPSIARIDHAWVSRRVSVRDCWTVEVPGSDHRAVVVELAPLD